MRSLYTYFYTYIEGVTNICLHDLYIAYFHISWGSKAFMIVVLVTLQNKYENQWSIWLYIENVYTILSHHTVTPHCHTTLLLHTATPHYHSSSGGCSSSGRYMPHHIVTGVVLVVGTRGGGHYLLAVYLSFNSLCGSDVICLWKELTKNRKDQQICLTLYVAFSHLPSWAETRFHVLYRN